MLGSRWNLLRNVFFFETFENSPKLGEQNRKVLRVERKALWDQEQEEAAAAAQEEREEEEGLPRDTQEGGGSDHSVEPVGDSSSSQEGYQNSQEIGY